MRLEHLGREIAKLRATKKLSLRATAHLTGLSHQAIHNAEHGMVSFESALHIAKKLGVAQKRLIILAKSDAEDLARRT